MAVVVLMLTWPIARLSHIQGLNTGIAHVPKVWGKLSSRTLRAIGYFVKR